MLRRKLFWALLGLGLLHFLLFFAIIYLKFQLPLQQPGFGRFIDSVLSSMIGPGKTYRDFLAAQGTVTMLMLAFAGEMLVGNDYREGTITFYLSRRVGRRHYIAGKLLSIAMVVSMMTTAPALVLYAEYGLLGGWPDYFLENPRILAGILGYGLTMSVVLGLLVFAFSAWLQRTAPLVMAWSCLFLFLPALGAVLRRVHDDRRWLLLSIWRDIRLIGSWCFGAVEPQDERAVLRGAVIVVAVISVISILAIAARVRALRSVS